MLPEPYDVMMDDKATEKCECAYCKEGMSETIDEYWERRIAVTRRLKESLRGVDWKQVFKNMYRRELNG